MQIPFIDYTRAYGQIKPEIDEAISHCLEHGDLIYREDTERFEGRFARLCGVKHCISTGSCSGAMFISLKALGLGMGHEVITVSHTYVATIDAIVATGALPVLVDIDPRTMNMDPDAFEKAITPWTKAVMPVHLNGRCCDMDRIMDIAVKHNLFVVEDAAQAVGATHNGKAAGSFGNTGCFSFYPAKVLGCYGEGGAVVTDDDELASTLYLMRDHGEWPPYIPKKNNNDKKTIYGWGFNTILDNIQAAILNVKLDYLEEAIYSRREIANRYDWAFCTSDNWDFTLSDDLVLPPTPTRFEYIDVFQNYAIRCEDRDGLEKHLTEKGIETIVSWRTPNHKQKGLGMNFDLPETEKLSNEVISLPLFPEMTDEEVEYVIECTRSYFQ